MLVAFSRRGGVERRLRLRGATPGQVGDASVQGWGWGRGRGHGQTQYALSEARHSVPGCAISDLTVDEMDVTVVSNMNTTDVGNG